METSTCTIVAFRKKVEAISIVIVTVNHQQTCNMFPDTECDFQILELAAMQAP